MLFPWTKFLLEWLGIDLKLQRNIDILLFHIFSPFEFENNLMTVCVYIYMYILTQNISISFNPDYFIIQNLFNLFPDYENKILIQAGI